MQFLPWTEGTLITASVVVLLVYHVRLAGRVRRAPLSTVIGHNNCLRQKWVAMVMRARRDLLAVQTLRNWISALPCILWFFGPLWMFCGAVGLVLLLTKLDRPPGAR